MGQCPGNLTQVQEQSARPASGLGRAPPPVVTPGERHVCGPQIAVLLGVTGNVKHAMLCLSSSETASVTMPQCASGSGVHTKVRRYVKKAVHEGNIPSKGGSSGLQHLKRIATQWNIRLTSYKAGTSGCNHESHYLCKLALHILAGCAQYHCYTHCFCE